VHDITSTFDNSYADNEKDWKMVWYDNSIVSSKLLRSVLCSPCLLSKRTTLGISVTNA